MSTSKALFMRSSARKAAIWLHRYVGLVMAVFLVVAGLTGSLLVFYRELDMALNPVLIQVRPPGPDAELLEPFEINRRVRLQMPAGVRHDYVEFDRKRDEAISAWAEIEPEVWREQFIDPYSGAILGSRDWGNLGEGIGNLMPFLYRLHYSLALGDVGYWLFGGVALLWTLDCFIGAYLTFPPPAQRSGGAKKLWLVRWVPAWLLRTTKLFSFVFTWHRASGLWVWAMLLVFAWSAVGLNLHEVYHPVMNAVVGMDQRTHDTLPELPPPHPDPGMTLQQAHERARQLMAEQSRQYGFQIIRELHLDYAADHGAFVYAVESSLDISTKYPDTELYFDGKDGHLIGFDAPTGGKVGNTLSTWLFNLHFGAVGGLWYRIFVSLMGIAVAALSVTGVWIWLKRRTKRVSQLDELGEVTP